MPASQPDLSMLWESGDPRAAMVKRFGFTDMTQVTDWLAGTLPTHWGIEVSSCERVVISAGNALAWITTDAGALVAKWSAVSRLHARLRELARLTAWLGRRALPVSAPLALLHKGYQLETDGVSLGLQRVVDGVHLDVTDQDLVHTAGTVLARLHLALAGYPDDERVVAVTDSGEPERLPDRVGRWLRSGDHERRPASAVAELRSLVAAAGSEGEVPAQLIHRDFRSGNVLCAGSRVVAVLDFEEARYDYCVVDIAHAAVMLGTQFRNWGPVPPATHEVFLAGYRSVRPLSPGEEAWLRTLILWRTLETGWTQYLSEVSRPL